MSLLYCLCCGRWLGNCTVLPPLEPPIYPSPAARTADHWYYVTHFECPVCGSCDEIRERRQAPRPQDPAQRHETVERYDWCDVL